MYRDFSLIWPNKMLCQDYGSKYMRAIPNKKSTIYDFEIQDGI